MSKFRQIEDFNIEFHGWYNMEPPPLLDYPRQIIRHHLALLTKRRGHIESYEHSRKGKTEMDEECNKGFEDICQVAKRNEPH
ncbi:hypothetical protein C1H46_030033 [Malus baccata]|uniref:Uncharacterized protein n=1 Tax=Malus baccata TaxID=106549 RepID=A0A540LDB9_MALBA|nr:hypothetical protein C1H46_030033 [Malus baccata]